MTTVEVVIPAGIDPSKGARFEVDGGNPILTTAATRPGLVYTLLEGATLESLRPGASKVGDGLPWTPAITVKGGASGFYAIGVGK